MTKFGVGVALELMILVLISCGSSGSAPEPQQSREVVSETTEEIDLSDFPLRRSLVNASVGDLVELSVEVTQRRDELRQCGKPTVLDTLGNPLSTLTPESLPLPSADLEGFQYRFAFFAAATGSYRVMLDNLDCSVAAIPANARVY